MTYRYCHECGKVLEISHEHFERAPVNSGPAVIEHSMHGSYFRPKYDEALGVWATSDRDRIQKAELIGRKNKLRIEPAK